MGLNRVFQSLFRALRGRVFLDAASGVPERRASSSARRRAERLWGNPSSPHAEGRAARAALDGARRSVARLLQVREGEVVFCSGGTEAANLGVLGAARALIAEGKPVTVAVAASSHPSVARAARAAGEEGAAVVEIHVDGRGAIAPESAAAAVGPSLTLVALPRVAGETGAVSDTRRVADACRRAAAASGGRAVVFVDAAQSALFEDVSPSRLGADLLALDGAKFGGPRGSGCLVARAEVLPVLFGGRQEGGRRPGTENVPAAAGFASALAEARRRAPEFARAAGASAGALWEMVSAAVPDARRVVPPDDSAPHYLTVCLPGRDGAYACAVLDELGVAASPSAACRAAAGERLFAGYPDPACAPSSVRFSFGEFTPRRSLARAARALARAAALAVLPSSSAPTVEGVE
jgi:cysteine desulfurase